MGLIEVMREYVTIDDQYALHIESLFRKKQYNRGAHLLRSGEVAHDVFFVVEGALRQFYVNEEGDERSCNFIFENDFITDLESFSQKTT